MPSDRPPPPAVYLDVHKATAARGAIQVSITNGRDGYRIAGPKYGGSGSVLLTRVALSQRDIAAIRCYLAECDGNA